MSKYIRFSARASLAVIGLWMVQMRVRQVIENQVRIKQKVIRYTPLEKLLDAFINILAGGHGIVEVNTRVRPDEGLQRAFGRDGCAEQSVVGETLNACTGENVEQMREAVKIIYRTHGRGYRHDYEQYWQVLDVDMTGMPAGRKGEGVTKGYFSGRRGRRGRQLGRVVATNYDEIVVERLYPGTVQLERSLQELMETAEEVLEPEEHRTIVRVDGGGGRDADVNWLLTRGYKIIIKVKNWQRSKKLTQSVLVWHPDPKVPGREVGWVNDPHEYARPTRQLVIRKPNKNGEWQYRALVFNLTDLTLLWLAHQPVLPNPTSTEALLAAVHAYDLRGGGAETTIKGSKVGLGLTKRNKRSFVAQEMLVLLAQLAYNLITLVPPLFSPLTGELKRLGPLRMVRDLFHISGKVTLNRHGKVLDISLNQAHAFAFPFAEALSPYRARDGTWLNLGQI
jgi:hypothetical protein